MEEIIDIDKIVEVYHSICLNTCHREKLVRFELAFSCNIGQIYRELKERTYEHQRYSLFLISSPKYRIVMSECMHDKIVNHLLCKHILIPCIYPKLIDMNVATRENMGTKMGIYYAKKYINKLKVNGKVYALKCDISKYFYNIDHKRLIEKLTKDIKNKEVLELIKKIVHSTNQPYVNQNIDKMIKKEIERLKEKNVPNLDYLKKQLLSLPKYKNGTGLPIGNETSQILAIYYLNSFDHFVKEKLKIKGYVRYMDDFILFSNDKEYLKECLTKIIEYLDKEHLILNKKTQIYDLDKGMNFLGYKFILKKGRLITLINNQTKKRVKRKLKKYKKNHKENYEQIKASYFGYFKLANSKNFLHNAKF